MPFLRRVLFIWLLLPSIVVTLPVNALTQPADQVAVLLDVDPYHGACSVTFQVRPGGADLLPRPDAASHPLLHLVEGSLVAGCDMRDGWTGVIVGDDEACGFAKILEVAEPYAGPCPSGWVLGHRLLQVAG